MESADSGIRDAGHGTRLRAVASATSQACLPRVKGCDSLAISICGLQSCLRQFRCSSGIACQRVWLSSQSDSNAGQDCQRVLRIQSGDVRRLVDGSRINDLVYRSLPV